MNTSWTLRKSTKQVFKIDRSFNPVIWRGKIFFKRSQIMNEPLHELQHMSLMIAYPRNIEAWGSCWLVGWCIFILLSRESDVELCFGRVRTRLGVGHFPSFPVDVLTCSHVNLLLVRSHQAEIIIVKRLIQGRNNVTRVRVELMILRSESS